MHQFLLSSHSILRYAVLILALYAITKSIRGLIHKQDYSEGHRKSALFFMISCHVQLLLGIVLFITGNWINNFSDMAATMKDGMLRFFTVEHTLIMFIAIALVTIGHSKTKKAIETRKKHKTSAIYFCIALLLILISIPWPFRDLVGRAWLPF